MQINGPVWYKCSFCKCGVHKVVVEEEKSVTCPFCDLPLRQTFFKDKKQDSVANAGEENSDLCADDCLREQLDVNGVEEEAFVNLDNFGYIPKAGPDWDQISISDTSTADDSDVDYIFEKEISEVTAGSVQDTTNQMDDS